jgi:hypothetical protein
MNYKNHLYVFLGCIVWLCQSKLHAQTKLYEEDIEFTNKNRFDQFYGAVNSETLETFFYTKTEDSLYLKRFSVGFIPKDDLKLKLELPKELKTMVGSRFENESKSRLYFTNKEFSTIYSLSIDLHTKTADSIYTFKIPLDEYVCQVFEHQNAFYLFSISKNEPWIRIYTFRNNLKPIIQTFNLDDFQVAKESNGFWNFKELIKKSNTLEFPYSIELIKEDFQPQLLQVAAKRKMYIDGGKIYISFDFNAKSTSWIVIDLKNQQTTYHETPLPTIVSKTTSDKNFNSFWYQNKVFAIKATSDSLKINIVDFETKSIVKQVQGNSKSIDFANTELFYNPGENKTFKKYKGSKHFLKKTKTSFWGISIFEENEGVLMQIGAVKENHNTTLIVGDIFLNGLMIAAGSDVGYEPILQGFSGIDFKTSFFESKLDFNFVHHLGSLEPNAEHKMNYFINENRNVTHAYIFKRLSYYVLSYYDFKENKIYFRKFD